MAQRTGRRWRQAVVWLHVLTSVSWMAQALALASLLTLALSASGPVRVAATTMARHLDLSLLAPMANASAFTGLLLSAGTAWGLSRYWWVLIKFAITLIQLYLGVFVLSGALDTAVTTARSGVPGPGLPLALGAGLMAAAIAFQAWLSITKPLPRTPWTPGRPKPSTAPRWIFAAGVGAVAGDLAIAALLGDPLPACSVAVLITAYIHRARGVIRTPAPAFLERLQT